MSRTHRVCNRPLIASLPLFALSASILAGCAAQVRVATPVVYAPPPPPPPAVAVVAGGADVVVQAEIAPPALPVYAQPPCPVDGWLWTPGYWAWGAAGYYWVPGTWVAPPRVGFLWTPGYWGFAGGVYVWHAGYWGAHIGFYGGVHYGFGYTGVGYAGGHWVGGVFAYNRVVTNVNVTIIHNTYNETVVDHVDAGAARVSYNGGAGGIRAMPTAEERQAEQQPHLQPTLAQRQHIQQAERNPALQARANGGHPAIAATPRAGAFNSPGAVQARGATPEAHGAAPGVLASAQQPGKAKQSHPKGAHGKPHPKNQHKPAQRKDQNQNG
jgi:hypothetical protein